MTGERRPAFPALLVWGVFLSVLTAVGLIFFRHGVETPALLGGGAAFVIVLAIGLAVTRGSLQGEGGGADPEGSPATVWLALSVALTALGAALGPWLALIGGGMTIVGVIGVARELRAQRRAGRGARESEPSRWARTAPGDRVGDDAPPTRQVAGGEGQAASGHDPAGTVRR